MAGMRSGHRLHLLKLVVPLGGIALWMCAGCAAKKVDLPPPPPPRSSRKRRARPRFRPLPFRDNPRRNGESAPAGGWPPSGRDVGQPPPDLRSGPMLVHKVRYPGESVSIIAGWYTGEIDNWKVLAEANPGLNPNVINEGMKINIPEYMLKTREPMTREYVGSFYPKSRSKSKGPAPVANPRRLTTRKRLFFGPKH